MPKVILVNPSKSTIGYTFITPRWLFVIARATPVEIVGDPIIVDESIERFNPEIVNPGDIVGIGIITGNCLAGYRVLREAKSRGATVIVAGVHATIFPEEPIEMGADAVVTGNGDVIWGQVVRDALDGRLKKKYEGGRVPGEAMLKARWDLLDPDKYMIATVQTVAGCPENCSFCSVWVTDGRQPRQRLSEKIIEEVNELYDLGFRYIFFADDNFNPATLGRIAREPSPQKRKELERIREERLRFFDEYDRSVPKNVFAFTQMTTEAISDEDYLSAMYHKARIRTALIGVESFTEEGLATVGKKWNPVGKKMVEAIRTIQAHGIMTLSSIICGLESDTIQTIRTMGDFAIESGSMLAQFAIYGPFPGTKDYHEMMRDRKNLGKADFVPKFKTKILQDRFWLQPLKPVYMIEPANMSSDELVRENKKCWDRYFSLREIVKRVRSDVAKSWSWSDRVLFIFFSLFFKRIYGGQGASADSVLERQGIMSRTFNRMTVGISKHFFRQYFGHFFERN
ncbi:MAG: radical SAM protein [Acidobacteriota bacterium]|nr:MAG: radical SAM protein [Acidobacteriota bacterium]